MKATFIKELDGFVGTAKLYQLPNGEFVVASAVVVPFSGPETYLFKADSRGEVTDWGELPGSVRGTLDIDRVVEEAPDL